MVMTAPCLPSHLDLLSTPNAGLSLITKYPLPRGYIILIEEQWHGSLATLHGASSTLNTFPEGLYFHTSRCNHSWYESSLLHLSSFNSPIQCPNSDTTSSTRWQIGSHRSTKYRHRRGDHNIISDKKHATIQGSQEDTITAFRIRMSMHIMC
jgi:hypothetical protein